MKSRLILIGWNDSNTFSMESGEAHFLSNFRETTITAQGISRYAESLGFLKRIEFLEWIKNKTTLDIGSGLGFLQRELSQEPDFSDTHIINLDPSIDSPTFSKEVNDLNEKKQDLFTKTEQTFRALSVKATSMALPFGDETFDRIVSSYSISWYYCENDDYEKFSTTLKEITRILKHEGEARLGPVEDRANIRRFLIENNSNDITVEHVQIFDDKGQLERYRSYISIKKK